MIRHGMTLIELLASATLLAAVAIALATWLRIGGRAAADAGALTGRMRSSSAAIRLLCADVGARTTPWTLSPDGARLQVSTINALPGDAPGGRTVTWSWNDGALARAEEVVADPSARNAGGGPRTLRFERLRRSGGFRTDPNGLLWISSTETAGDSADPAVIVWQEWR